MEKPFPAYNGDEPYVFVSYAHEDAAHVYPEIRWLRDQGFNIWYDEGLRPGSQWHTELAEAIENCSLCLYFVSPRSVKSAHCEREVHYAIDQHRQVLPVHLEPAQLPSGLRLSLSSVQAIMRFDFTEEQYRAKLLSGMTDNTRGVVTEAATVRAKARNRSKKVYALLGLAVAIALGAFAYYSVRGSSDDSLVSNDQIAPVRSNWVAILPFRAATASADAGAQLLADGVTADLISALSGLGMFSVMSHGAVRTYENSTLSPQQISARLGVRYLIEGRVQQAGQQTRIGVTLVEGVDGRTLWQENKSYQSLNLLDVQDDITRFVSRALDVELVRFETERVSGVPDADMQAWDLYVSALSVWEDVDQETVALAISKHRRALELEPEYVLAMGQLATLLTNVAQNGTSPDRTAVQMEACQLADRVATLGQESPYAIFSAVHVLSQMCGEAGRAVLIARRTVAAYPNSGYNQTLLGDALLHAGRLDEALQVLESAESAFSDNIWVARYTPFWKSMVFTEREEWQKVVTVSGASLDLNPWGVTDAFILANALGVLNEHEQANAIWERIRSRFPTFTVENLEWFLRQGLIDDERINLYVRGLKSAGVED